MYERLYPHDHPAVAQNLTNLGTLLVAQGEYARARTCLQRALAMRERLYPPDAFPRGRAELAQSLYTLGVLYQAQGDYARALTYWKRTLATYERLYPPEEFPRGHPGLAGSLHNLGLLFQSQGKYAEALSYHERVLKMYERLYPAEEFPRGHIDLVGCFHNLGLLWAAQRDHARARSYLVRALDMNHDLAELFAADASEAEALNFAAALPRTRDLLLSEVRLLPDTGDAGYGHVWRSKAAVTHLLQRRQHALATAADLFPADHPQREKIRQRAQDLQATRQTLARLMLAPARDRAAHRRHVQELGQSKERLERELAELWPAFGRQQDVRRRDYTALLDQLPPQAVFVDAVRYVRFEQDAKTAGKAGERRTPCYVAFVLCRGQPVRRVELNEAAPIERALSDWRREITGGKTGTAGQTLRKLVWEPLAPHVPADTQTVLVAPDGALTRLPWAALPGAKPGRVLLEEHALAVVPHGPFLLERLTAPAAVGAAQGLLLAVGGVEYDQNFQPGPPPPEASRVARRMEGGEKGPWPYLPATAEEIERVRALAGSRPVGLRRGTEASTTQLLADLPQARWAHLATHGFFADADFRSGLQLDEQLFERPGAERASAGARNPQVLSGLVLAGANLPAPADLHELLHSDGGILTAEAIAGLPLYRLELAVLSACETGLGEVAGGEGVFGLQRAFHLAGAQTVVASLWKVDDRATKALMVEFYRNLWEKKLSRLEALRQAQLTVRRGYDPQAGKLRGLEEVDVNPKAARPPDGAPPRYWAAFALSGEWR